MTAPLILHYAPDNASLIVRLALEHRGIAYQARLVDRAVRAEKSAVYRALNPNGLIPTLETPQGPIFETGAILLWLADRYGGLGPGPDDPLRGAFLKWLFFLANTVHATEVMLFHSERYVPPETVETLQETLRDQLRGHFVTLETLASEAPPYLGAAAPTVLDFYLAALLRWPALYPAPRTRWHRIADYPALSGLCAGLESLACCRALQKTEGLGTRPFTDPDYPNPPEGSAN